MRFGLKRKSPGRFCFDHFSCGQKPKRFRFDDHSSIRFVQKIAHVLPPMLDVKLVKIDWFMMGFQLGTAKPSEL